MSKCVFILIRRELTRDHNTIISDTTIRRQTQHTQQDIRILYTKWHTPDIGFDQTFYLNIVQKYVNIFEYFLGKEWDNQL